MSGPAHPDLFPCPTAQSHHCQSDLKTKPSALSHGRLGLVVFRYLREVSITGENSRDEETQHASVHLALLSYKCRYFSTLIYWGHLLTGRIVNPVPHPVCCGRITERRDLERAWQEGNPLDLLKGSDLGETEAPMPHSTLKVVQDHGRLSRVY